MPLYEYKCPECGAKFERLMTKTKGGGLRCPVTGRVVQGLRVTCEECGHIAHRVPHPGGAFALKGWWPGKGGQ